MRTNFIHMIFGGVHPSHLMIMISQIASKGDSHIHIVFLQVRSTCNNFDTDQSNTKMTDANPDPSKEKYIICLKLKAANFERLSQFWQRQTNQKERVWPILIYDNTFLVNQPIVYLKTHKLDFDQYECYSFPFSFLIECLSSLKYIP